jgi:two-component system, OmpR family, KDP operon response regulator KdpE
MSRGARVLVVEDDPEIIEALRRGLTGHGYDVTEAHTGQAAFAALTMRPPDVVLLDLGLPDRDGLEVVRRVRAAGSTPIVVLSARDSEAAKVEALTLGADDYLAKPFGMKELLARIQVALRHAARPASGAEAVYRTGELAIDFDRRQVVLSGEPVHLTPTEYDLLKALVTHPDKVLTHRMLLQLVWGGEQGTDQHYLHVYIGQLRRKIERDPSHPRHLLTEPGVGYRFSSE